MRAASLWPGVLLVAAALLGCESSLEENYERPFVETRPAEPLTGTARPAPSALSPLGADEAKPVERVVQRGTGTFASPPERRVQASMTTAADGEIMLNVVDGELREVVRMVLESALGANYVIDPAIGGRITIQTTRPLPPEDLVPVLDARPAHERGCSGADGRSVQGGADRSGIDGRRDAGTKAFAERGNAGLRCASGAAPVCLCD